MQATAQLDQIGTTAGTTPIPVEPPTPETPMGEPADPTAGEGTPAEEPPADGGDTPEAEAQSARRTRGK